MEFKRLKARDVIITSNLNNQIGHFGQMVFDDGRVNDHGVAIYFTLHGISKTLACDKWNWVGDNLWAIFRHVEATRGLARWGVGNIEQAFAGYTALPFSAAAQSWHEILGVGTDASQEEIQKAYRARAKARHPDVGGANAEMAALNAAYDAAMEHLRARTESVR